MSSRILTPSLQALSSGSAEPDGGMSVEALVESQLPWIRRRLRSLFPPHLDLDELEQKVLLNVLRSLPSYRGEGSLRAWVDSITVRVGLSHARRVRARERREQSLSEGLGDTEQRLPSETYFTRCQVQGLLSVLPPEQERAVVLHHVIGLEVRGRRAPRRSHGDRAQSAPPRHAEAAAPGACPRNRAALARRKRNFGTNLGLGRGTRPAT